MRDSVEGDGARVERLERRVRELEQQLRQMQAAEASPDNAEPRLQPPAHLADRLRELTDVVPHLLWELTPDGSLSYTNRRFREYLGSSEVAPPDWSKVVHPEDLPILTARWTRYTEGRMNDAEYEVRLRDTKGEYRWFMVRSVPVFDASGSLLARVGSATDIAELKRAQEALRESQGRLQAALEAAGMGTWLWDVASDRYSWDEATLRLLGRSPGSATGTAAELFDAVHPEDRAAVQRALDSALVDGGFDAEFRIIRGDRAVLWLRSTGRLKLDSQGKPALMVGACVDLTRHKQLEEQLRQAQKMEAIGQLAGGVAHDFNNILTVILGEASLLAASRDVSTVERSAANIIKAAERAAELTAQLLAFGRRQLMQTHQLDANELLADLVTMLQRTLGENIVVAGHFTEQPIWVSADTTMLTQVLLNLAINARDAMPQGGTLTLRASIETLDATAAQRYPDVSPGCWACLTVSDTGSGIEQHVRERMFEPFFTTKRLGEGTGLGLSMAYGIVRQHGGAIAVDSELGQGTTFRVLLPLAESHALPVITEATPLRPVGHGETILLVEDEEGVRTVVQSMLERHGYDVVVATTGREALETFARTTRRIALLLTDIVMPDGVTGADVAEQLRARCANMKVILSSGYGAEVLGTGPVPYGMTFLRKPYKVEDLLTTIRRTLDER